jgi:uncharacterized membrane protein
MTGETLRTATAAIAVALAIVVSWSIVTRNFIVPIIAIVLAIGLSYLLRRGTKEVTGDERTSLLYEKAAGATIRFCVLVAGVGGVIIIALQDHLPADMVSVAYTLAYTACVLLLVHLAFYSYYSRKH